MASFLGSTNKMVGQIESVDGKQARLMWENRVVAIPLPENAGAGDRVEYYLRSEKIRIVRQDKPQTRSGVNRIEGLLRDVIFKGQYADYYDSFPDGAEIMVSDQPSIEGIRRGGNVRISRLLEDGGRF